MEYHEHKLRIRYTDIDSVSECSYHWDVCKSISPRILQLYLQYGKYRSSPQDMLCDCGGVFVHIRVCVGCGYIHDIMPIWRMEASLAC